MLKYTYAGHPLLIADEQGNALGVVVAEALACGRPVLISNQVNIWPEIERIPITSIKEGARALKARQRNWGLWSLAHFRRAQLIQDLLPHVGIKPLVFPAPVPAAIRWQTPPPTAIRTAAPFP